MERVNRAKMLWSRRSQAVRLPKEFRFEGDQVRIRRRGSAVILEPIPEDWGWLDDLAAAGRLDTDFVEAVAERPAAEERPGFNTLFG